MKKDVLGRAGVGRCVFMVVVLCGSLGSGFMLRAASDPLEVFATGFEPPTYEVGFTLADQESWLSDAVGGNQVFSNYFAGMGQHALVGYSPPEGEGTNYSVSVWRPLNFDPIAAGLPVVTFTVTMSIADSIDPALRDSFRWSVYNTNTAPTRLFSLDFDNASRSISYLLDDDEGFVETPFLFERDGLYDLAITMDFASNRWNARLNDELVVEDQAITTMGSALHLGDIDAVWVMAANSTEFGRNYMVFDEYRVMAASVPASRLSWVEHRADGASVIELQGPTGKAYAIDATADLQTWSALITNNIPSSGRLTHVDTTATNAAVRFYRGRLVE